MAGLRQQLMLYHILHSRKLGIMTTSPTRKALLLATAYHFDCFRGALYMKTPSLVALAIPVPMSQPTGTRQSALR